MENKNVGNWLIVGGGIILVIGTLLWIILFSIFTLISTEFFIGLIIIPTSIGFCSIIVGCVLNEKWRAKGVLTKKEYHITGVVFIILGIYICLGLLLVDSPFGPPILGTHTMDLDLLIPDIINSVYLGIMFGSVFMMILSGLVLLFWSSKQWVIIGLVVLVIAVGGFQYWLSSIIGAYSKMMGGGPP